MKKKPIYITLSKSTGEYTHTDRDGKKVKITSLPPKANLKAVFARAKAMGLGVK